jgi:hypothetical protein
MLQLEPSQCIVSVRSWWPVCTLSYVPTAQTLPLEIAATSRSWFVASAVLLGFGLATSVQTDPFQWSVNVDARAPKPVFVPTAQASVGESALIESRLLWFPGCGLGTTLQDVPLKCSMMFPVSFEPTAQTSFGPVAPTELR